MTVGVRIAPDQDVVIQPTLHVAIEKAIEHPGAEILDFNLRRGAWDHPRRCDLLPSTFGDETPEERTWRGTEWARDDGQIDIINRVWLINGTPFCTWVSSSNRDQDEPDSGTDLVRDFTLIRSLLICMGPLARTVSGPYRCVAQECDYTCPTDNSHSLRHLTSASVRPARYRVVR